MVSIGKRPENTVPEQGNPNKGITREDQIIIGMLVMAAFVIRLHFLPYYHVISNDGTAYVTAARALGAGDLSGISSYGFYPILVWIAHLLPTDWETAGRIASMVLGSLLMIPLYLLGCTFFPRQTVIAACILTLSWGTIRHWSCEVMSQSTYMTLALVGIYCVRKMIDNRSWRTGLAAGIAFGLAYMTRTEGVLLFFVMPLAPLIAARKELNRLILTLIAYIAGFGALLVLNMVLVHQATGSWQLAAKTSVALNDGLMYYLNIPDLNYIPDYQPKGYLDILRIHPEYYWHNTLKNSLEAVRSILPLPLLILALAGFLSGGFRRQWLQDRLFLFSSFAPLLVIIVFYYIGPEYTQPYLPVLFLWVSAGMHTVLEVLLQRFDPKNRLSRFLITPASATVALAIACAAALTIQQLSATSPDAPYTPRQDDGRRDQKHMGLILKQHLPPGKIMTRWARIAFYAEREWSNIPKADFNQIMQTARDSKVRFLIVDGGLWGIRPELGDDLFAPVAMGGLPNGLHFQRDPNNLIRPGLRPFMAYMNNPTSMGFVVYEVLY